MTALQARVARNEVVFRAINDRIRELAARFDQAATDPLAFVCECADETCVERVPLTIAQYDEMRATGTRFVVAPCHEVA